MQVGNWTDSYEYVQFVLEVSMAQGESREHLGSTLRMANIRELLVASSLKDEVNLGWSIIFAKFKETIIEVFLEVFIGI